MNFLQRKVLVPAALALCVGLFALTPVSEASCAGPIISLNTKWGERGVALTVTGQGFAIACDNHRFPGPLQPAKKIKIFLKQGKKSTLLATVDAADSNLRFSVLVTIPASATYGKATLTAEAHSHTTRPVDFEILESARQ